MGKVLILQNAPLFTAGNFEDELKRKELPYEYLKVYEGARLPGTEGLKHYSGVIVLGGSLALRVDQPEKQDWLLKELSFLRHCIDQHYPVFAVSQGASLLAQAQGAWVDRKNTLKEIGWVTAEVYPDYSRNSVIYEHVDEKKFPAFRWSDSLHGFPPKGYWYVYSPNCRYLSTGINGNCYLFDFHPEINESLLQTWLKEHGREIANPELVAQIQAEAPEKIEYAKQLSRKIIHAFESFLKD